MSQLRKGDRIFARCAGWYGYGTLTEDQAGDLVTFRREKADPEGAVCTIKREKCSFIPPNGWLSTPLADLAGNGHEFRRMGSFARLKVED
jgi:hypothetical protein